LAHLAYFLTVLKSRTTRTWGCQKNSFTENAKVRIKLGYHTISKIPNQFYKWSKNTIAVVINF
jgi:hypothetical protein